MNIFSNNLAKILKGILRWEVIGGITSLIALLFAYSQFKHDRGGELTAYINNEIAYNEEQTNIAIFVDNPYKDISNAINITPTLGNNTEYSIRDFSLQYHISTHDIDIEPSDYYDIYEEKDILTHVKEVSAYLEEKLERLVETYDFITARRGKGLIQGLVVTVKPADVCKKALENGLVIISAGADVLRIVPPLVIEKEHVDEMICKLEHTFSEILL